MAAISKGARQYRLPGKLVEQRMGVIDLDQAKQRAGADRGISVVGQQGVECGSGVEQTQPRPRNPCMILVGCGPDRQRGG